MKSGPNCRYVIVIPVYSTSFADFIVIKLYIIWLTCNYKYVIHVENVQISATHSTLYKYCNTSHAWTFTLTIIWQPCHKYTSIVNGDQLIVDAKLLFSSSKEASFTTIINLPYAEWHNAISLHEPKMNYFSV